MVGGDAVNEPTFPDIVMHSLTRHGVTPNRGYVTLGHYDALICHYPPEPERPFIVHWTRSSREPDEFFGELTTCMRDAGARSAEWWFRDDSTPEGLEELVLAAGATTTEDQVCVARAVDGGLPEISEGVRVTLVQDEEAVDVMVDIGVAVFDMPEPTDRAELRAEVLEELSLASGAWVIGWLDGEAVGRARVGFEWNVAPLTGAGVLPHARRRGVYAAMLAARLDLAATAGCHTAVTKARRTQSLPILLREGFTAIGHERAHLLEISG